MLIGDNEIGKVQTRVTGRILFNGSEPNTPQEISWESSLYWIIYPGDTIENINKTYINYYTGEYIIVKLPPLISTTMELVPTIEPTSISGKDGKINVMISPMQKMRGDTMIIKATHNASNQSIYTKIILE